jgi:hypothetical protein
MSPDNSLFIDTWSTVTNPPISVLRKVADGSTVLELEKADVSQLEEAGWRAPEVFVAKGRDGVTDIWGIIVRPLNFDPNKKYPVIEYIYAGPHDSHVPKNFSPTTGLQTYAELGFIVVQMTAWEPATEVKRSTMCATKTWAMPGSPTGSCGSGGSKEIPLHGYHTCWHLWHLGRGPELNWRRALPSRFLRRGRLFLRMPR